MNRQMASCAMIVTFWVGGCSMSDRDGSLTMRLTGIVIEDTSASPPHYHFANLEEISAEIGDALGNLEADSWYASRQILKVAIKQTLNRVDYDYEAVIVPQSPGELARWRLANAGQGIHVSGGAILMWGFRPRAFTDWVAAGSYGSTLALEIADAATQNLYFLRGTAWSGNCKATATSPSISFDFIGEKKFFKFPTDCIEPPVPQDIGATDPPALKRLKDIAIEAGWTEGP